MTTKKAAERPKWSEEQTKAFEQLRDAVTSDSVLISPDTDKNYILCMDAFTKGVGAVLCQLDDLEQEKPIAYFSRKLKKYQRSYTVTELELLAIVSAAEHFQIYLTGSQFIIYTDHKALLSIDKLKTANARLTRWSLLL